MESETIDENKPTLRRNHSCPIQIPIVNEGLHTTEDGIYPDPLDTPKSSRSLSDEPAIYSDPNELRDQFNRPSFFNWDCVTERSISSGDSCFRIKRELISAELNELSCNTTSDDGVTVVGVHKNNDVEGGINIFMSDEDKVKISKKSSNDDWPIGVLLEKEVEGENIGKEISVTKVTNEEQISFKPEYKLSQTELKDVHTLLQCRPLSMQDICGTKWPGGFTCNGDKLYDCKTHYKIIPNQENYSHLGEIQKELIENVAGNILEEKLETLLSPHVLQRKQISTKQEHKSSQTELKDVRTVFQYWPVRVQDICSTKWPGSFICNGDKLCDCKTYYKIITSQENHSHLDEIQNKFIENVTGNKFHEKGERLLSPHELQRKQSENDSTVNAANNESDKIRKEDESNQFLIDECDEKNCGGSGEKTRPKKRMFSRFFNFFGLRLSEKRWQRFSTN